MGEYSSAPPSVFHYANLTYIMVWVTWQAGHFPRIEMSSCTIAGSQPASQPASQPSSQPARSQNSTPPPTQPETRFTTASERSASSPHPGTFPKKE